MTKESEFSLRNYSYELAQDKIAPFPLRERSDSKLLVLDRSKNGLCDVIFKSIGDYLKKGDLLVFNDSRVINARLFGKKKTGGKVEILLIRPSNSKEDYKIDSRVWEAMISPSRSLKQGMILDFEDLQIEILKRNEFGNFEVEFKIKDSSDSVKSYLEVHGFVPIPPYITKRRELSENPINIINDKKRYQNVFAKHDGSVAAPTAGFHFDDGLLDSLKEKGIETTFVTLHVGPGTFKPVKVDDIRDHKMDREWYSISDSTHKMIKKAKKEKRRVIAVGTTSVRVLESVFTSDSKKGFTELFIYPGYEFKVVDAMITNFHTPGSTLLMLVSAFAGKEKIMKAYEYAVKSDYRFYSYGDAMLIL